MVRRARVRVEPGKMYNRLLAVSVALTRVEPGDGGFCVIRGSHKSNMPCPGEMQRYETCREFVDNPAPNRATCSSSPKPPRTGRCRGPRSTPDARVCTGSRRRRPRTDARTVLRLARGDDRGGLTPRRLAVLEPPYHPRLDRPALTLAGEVEGQRRAEFKKEHDAKVFGSRYF